MNVFQIRTKVAFLLTTLLMVLFLTLTRCPFEGMVQMFQQGQPKPQPVGSQPQPPIEKFSFAMVDAAGKEATKRRLSSMTDEDWEAEAFRLIEKNKVDGKYVIITAANNGYREFTLNWIASLKRNNYHEFLVFCLDSMLYEALAERSLSANAVVVPRKWLHRPVSTEELTWDTKDYKVLTHAKVTIAYKLLSRSHTVVFSDVDIVWLSPGILAHLEYVTENADMAHMIDFVDDINTGFYMAKPSLIVKALFRTVIEALKAGGENVQDQEMFSSVIEDVAQIKYSKYLYPLDKLMYPNGEVYFKLELNKKMGIRPMIVHANYIVGAKMKKKMLQSRGMWYI